MMVILAALTVSMIAIELRVVVQQTTPCALSSSIALRVRLTDLVGSEPSSYEMTLILNGKSVRLDQVLSNSSTALRSGAPSADAGPVTARLAAMRSSGLSCATNGLAPGNEMDAAASNVDTPSAMNPRFVVVLMCPSRLPLSAQ